MMPSQLAASQTTHEAREALAFGIMRTYVDDDVFVLRQPRSRPAFYSAGVPLSLDKNGSLIFSM